MQRRNFIQILGGSALVAPRLVRAETELALHERVDDDAPLFLFVNAVGGWDPVYLCDPKGSDPADPKRISNYPESAIQSAGNIRYAPLGNNAEFFAKYHSRLTVINGIDTQTNNHAVGQKVTMSGKVQDGYPSVAALIAGHRDPSKPMAYLSFGGYDRTFQVVSRARAGNLGVIPALAFPNHASAAQAQTAYHPPPALDALERARQRRRELLGASPRLPRSQRTMDALFTARGGAKELERIQPHLPTTWLDSTLGRQGQVALAAYKAGICSSANLALNTFDTHGNHDALHIPMMVRLLEGVDEIVGEAERQGVADRTVVVMCSDFGRTPYFNAFNGKDHWAVTSMMVMGPGIAGNRVIGATDAGYNAKRVNAGTLEVDDGGELMTPAHIHRSVRRLAGIHESPLAKRFPLDGVELPLF